MEHENHQPIAVPSFGALFRRPGIRLFITSGLLLFVELLLIRWIPANVVYVGFFRNFVLMASFLGIGLGILYGRANNRSRIPLFPLLLLATVVLVGSATLEANVSADNEIFFGLTGTDRSPLGVVTLPLVVVLATILLATLAVPLGGLLTAMPPLRAYAIDVAGSMAGITLFTLLSALETTPAVWFVVVAAALSVLALGSGVSRRSLVGAGSMVGVVVLAAVQANGSFWSPYYKITETSGPGAPALFVNGIPHQAMQRAVVAESGPFYSQVYRWFPGRVFQNVLIVGAGSGTDVAVNLAHDAAHVDAVEIDPRLLAIGVEQHPDRPYADPRVTRYVNDGRAFLRQTHQRYDLVVFALPDSLTLVSSTANIRLESFLFTTNAFADVREHLSDDGVFVLYNYYREPWLIEKLAGMLATTFGHEPLVRLYASGTAGAATLAAGPAVASLPAGRPPGDFVDDLGRASVIPATDDWPFLYLREPTLPGHYVLALGLLLAFALVAVLRAAHVGGTSIRRFSPHFFVLGIAFLLLETRSIVTFSLLFGTTWIVNSLVFFAILASVMLAIGVNVRWPIRQQRWLYLALVAAIGVAFVLPPASLLIDPPPLRYLVAGLLAFAPVFLANLVFTSSFRDTRTADMAFASNLLGAMVGGAIEYLALLTGYQALLLVVGGLYVAAWLLATRVRVLADRDLPVPGFAPGLGMATD